MEPTDWFRIRHREAFSDEALAAFRASCAIYRAKMEAIVHHWDDLPTLRTIPKPSVVFFEPEISPDRCVVSLPVRIDQKTLGSRSLFQSTASRELFSYLPSSTIFEIEVGLTEPAFQGTGWRNDWWNPHKDNSIGPEEAFRRLGFKLKPDPEHPSRAQIVPGWRRRLQWLLRRGQRL